MRNIKLTIEYDGTAYCGWQVQPNGVTVQAVLQKAIRKMAGHKIDLQGASRTDSGVHAYAQVANFKTSSKIPCIGFLRGLNSLLPEDIVVRNVEEVPLEFHAKRDARAKHYRYLIVFGETRPAILRDRVWFAPTKVGHPALGRQTLVWEIAKKINKAAQALVGTHDFTSFCGAGDNNKTKVREIYGIQAHVIASRREAAWQSPELNGIASACGLAMTNQLIAIDIIGSGFLKYMVRNIVGTLVEMPQQMKKILAACDRKKAGVTAPACGLYLVEVKY